MSLDFILLSRLSSLSCITAWVTGAPDLDEPDCEPEDSPNLAHDGQTDSLAPSMTTSCV